MRGDDHHEAAFAVDVVKDLAPPDSGTVPHLTLRAFIFGGSNRGSTTSSGERAWGWGRRLNPTWARPAQSSRWDEDLYAGWPPRREPVRSDILLEVDNATRFTEAFHEPCEPGRPVGKRAARTRIVSAPNAGDRTVYLPARPATSSATEVRSEAWPAAYLPPPQLCRRPPRTCAAWGSPLTRWSPFPTGGSP